MRTAFAIGEARAKALSREAAGRPVVRQRHGDRQGNVRALKTATKEDSRGTSGPMSTQALYGMILLAASVLLGTGLWWWVERRLRRR